jgi:methylmalonyl-CoA mutase
MTISTISPATSFADDFHATEEDWRRAAEAALKGRPLDGLIAHRSVDGHTIDAITPRRPARPIAGRPAGARWIAMTRIDLADPAAANAQALEDLNNGASGLSFMLSHPGDGLGVRANTLDRFDRALDGVLLDLAPLHLETAPFEGRVSAAMAVALVERRKLDPRSVNILFGIDLLRGLARMGALPVDWAELTSRLAELVSTLRRRGFASPVLMIDARLTHNAGGGETQELAGALAGATEHVRALLNNGIELDVAADAVAFAVSADADQFATIAKIRALRLLWAAWRREAGLDDRPAHIHAETSRRMMTLRDPHTNMIRTTIAAFAAGVGGVDSLTVLPYTAAFGASDEHGRRLARNVQSIALEESNAHRVADPAAGAGAIERLTDSLAERAWGLFQEIERWGGLLHAIRSGAWQKRITDVRDARAANVARRKTPIVGVSEFPQAGETLPTPAREEVPQDASAAASRTGDSAPDMTLFKDIVGALHSGASILTIRAGLRPNPVETVPPLDLARLSQPFEELRAQNENEALPGPVFLALVGPIVKHSARAGFVRNLLTAGGLSFHDGPIAADPETIADAFAASGARLAILCGADEGYSEQGAELVAALKARGAAVWLAGRPRDLAEALSQAGVTRFVAAGDDALETLREAARAAAGGA